MRNEKGLHTGLGELKADRASILCEQAVGGKPAPPWPPEQAEVPPTTTYFDHLSDALAMGPDALRAARERRDLTGSMVADALRPHCLDVDVIPCGSYASGTAVAATAAIDLVIRVWSEPTSWERSSRQALTEVKRWLSYSCDNPLEETGRGLRIEFDDEGPDVQLLVFLPVGLDGGHRPSLASNRPGEGWLPADPAGHSDLVRARNAALGHCRFAKTVRLLKHLVWGWEQQLDRPLISSYVIEALALDYFRAPFDMAEGVAGFLSFAAGAGQDQIADPVGEPQEVDDPARFSAQCREASAQVADALTADVDPAGVIRELFGQAADRVVGV